jgi:hypothetical protein
MLEYVKLTLRIKTNAYDTLLSELIRAGAQDLGLAGVVNDELDIEHIDEVEDSLIRRAIATYVCCNFGNPTNYDRLKKSYDEQKAQLSMATGYTEWSND